MILVLEKKKKKKKTKKKITKPVSGFSRIKGKKKKGKGFCPFGFLGYTRKKNLKEKLQKERSILGLVVFLLDKRRRTTVDKEHQTNNLVCWKVLCKLNKKIQRRDLNSKEGFELKTLSSRAKAHPNKPHALL